MKPFPKNPDLQEQLKLPTKFVQIAFESHPPLFVKHSLISFSQKFPSNASPVQLQYAAFVSVLSMHFPLLVQFNLSHPIFKKIFDFMEKKRNQRRRN